MKLYVMRHGETDWNAKRLLQGWHDIPLNENGIRQAYEAKERLKDIHFDAIYSSTQIRALKTAEIVNEDRGLPIVTDSRFRERHYGVYEGSSFGSYNVGNVWDYDANVQFEGEDIHTFIGRIFEALDEMKEKHRGEQVLLVCHGGTMRGISAYFEGFEVLPAKKKIASNGQVLIFETD